MKNKFSRRKFISTIGFLGTSYLISKANINSPILNNIKNTSLMKENIFDFVGGNTGQWKVQSIKKVVGESLPIVSHIQIKPGTSQKINDGTWVLKGVRSNLRYTSKQEDEKLLEIQEGLGRPTSTFGALIPIHKNDAWWALAQDERRRIFEEQSQHIKKGMKYLPAIARRLYHSRDFNEPFDFLTWFEYAPSDANAFEELVALLRTTEEWKYVDREIDIRLISI